MEGERRPTGGAGGGGPVKPDVKGSGGSGGGGGGSRGAIFDDPLKAAETGTPDTVVVHPLVLLSVVDHFFRMGYKDAKDKRVVGVILGEVDKGRVDVVNSFALPFEEDPKDPGVFYLDHDYLESMYSMFRKVRLGEAAVAAPPGPLSPARPLTPPPTATASRPCAPGTPPPSSLLSPPHPPTAPDLCQGKDPGLLFHWPAHPCC